MYRHWREKFWLQYKKCSIVKTIQIYDGLPQGITLTHTIRYNEGVEYQINLILSMEREMLQPTKEVQATANIWINILGAKVTLEEYSN